MVKTNMLLNTNAFTHDPASSVSATVVDLGTSILEVVVVAVAVVVMADVKVFLQADTQSVQSFASVTPAKLSITHLIPGIHLFMHMVDLGFSWHAFFAFATLSSEPDIG